jgi:hypothetical protein
MTHDDFCDYPYFIGAEERAYGAEKKIISNIFQSASHKTELNLSVLPRSFSFLS